MDVFEHVSKIDLARSRLFSPGIITTLKISNFIPTFLNIRNQVAFGDLLVVDVEEDFAGRVVDRLADSVGLWRSLQKCSAVVGVPVEWLKHHHEFVGIKDIGTAPQEFDHDGRLLLHRASLTS